MVQAIGRASDPELPSTYTPPQSTPVAENITNDFMIAFPSPTQEDKGDYLAMPLDDQARFVKALERLQVVWASQAFQSQILVYRFKPYNNEDGISADVYKNITGPHPKLLSLYLCAGDDNALATTKPSTHQTCMFRAYLHNSRTTVNDLVGTMSHEYTHTTLAGGYTHPYLSKCAFGHIGVGCNRERTVPYAVGNIAESIANNIFPAAAPQ